MLALHSWWRVERYYLPPIYLIFFMRIVLSLSFWRAKIVFEITLGR